MCAIFSQNLVPPQKSTDRFFDADFDVLGRCDVNYTFGSAQFEKDE
jgi:hypothetical protein